jgi:hypothetical protein
MVFPQKKPELKTGHDINLRFVHNNAGDPPFFNGYTLYFDNYEAIVGELGVGK